MFYMEKPTSGELCFFVVCWDPCRRFRSAKYYVYSYYLTKMLVLKAALDYENQTRLFNCIQWRYSSSSVCECYCLTIKDLQLLYNEWMIFSTQKWGTLYLGPGA